MHLWTDSERVYAKTISENQTANQLKPHKVIGTRRKYNDNTIPPLDFRSNHWDALFGITEVQNCPLLAVHGWQSVSTNGQDEYQRESPVEVAVRKP